MHGICKQLKLPVELSAWDFLDVHTLEALDRLFEALRILGIGMMWNSISGFVNYRNLALFVPQDLKGHVYNRGSTVINNQLTN